MSSSTKNLDPAFQGVGQKIGLEIWRIENFQPVPLPKSDYGKFYSGDSYIILMTACGKGGSFIHDIHFWIGKDSTQDEYINAAIKSVELDASIGGKTIINREIQFYESDKFLSYFKPCIIPLNGGFISGFKKEKEKFEFENRLYVCRGKRIVRIKQVPFARSSLNHDDVFILDTELKIYQFNGANSNIQDRAKALEVVQFLKDKYHNGHDCDIAIVDDGKLVPEFWAFFGGFAPIGKKIILEEEIFPQITPPKLYSIEDGELKLLEGVICKDTLENNKCYLLDCGAQIFIWAGKITQVDERQSAIKATEEFIMKENKPKGTQIMQINQGYEPISFKSKFENWTAVTSTGTSSAEQGKGIVAALLKQQGLNAKGATKGLNANEQIPPLLQGGGKLEVWRINGSAKTPVSKGEIGKFYSGDCYIILYTYYFNEKKEEYFLSCWMGKDSVQDDQIMATRLANTMWGSLKGRPVQGLIYQGNEPPQFIALFEPMIILKGGISTGYKKFISENNINDETYNSDKIALIQISGTSIYNNNSVQVNPSAEFLCSSDCFLLQSGKNSVFLWQGNSSTFEQQKLATKIAEFLKPGVNIKNIKEGNESSLFWSSIGGKSIFNGKQINHELIRDPHLYSFSQNKGKLEIAEIYNFCQDDLLTEDILILDTNAEIFIWIGNSVDSKDKLKAFEIGQQYIEMQLLEKNLTKNVPIYKVTEGNEPCFFTNYFSWDHTKAMPQGNSFEKKLAHIFGSALNLSEASEKRKKATNGREATQRAAALAALSSAFSPPSDAKISSPKSQSQSSQRSTAVAALNTVLTGEQKSQPSTRGSSPVTPITERKSPSAVSMLENLSPESKDKETDSPVVETTGEEPKREKITTGEEPKREKTNNEEGKSIFSYEQLKSKSNNPVSGIDYKQREAYLSDLEFETVFGMSKEKFYFQPKWKQEMQKKKVDLF